jgi:putative transposase
MAAPYSLDLRERVLRAVDERPVTIAEIALQFSVSQSAIYAWLARRKATGLFAPKPHAGGRALSVDEDGGKLLSELVEAQNDRTLDEYADAYHERRGVRLSRSALQRAMVRLDLPRKKKHSAPRTRTDPT